MKLPKLNNFSKASKLSVLAIVILAGAIFFTVNSALQEQNGASHASTDLCYWFGGYSNCSPTIQPAPSNYYGYNYPTPTPFLQNCKQVWTGFTYTIQCTTPTPVPPTPNPTQAPLPTAVPTTPPTTQGSNILTNPGCEQGTTNLKGFNATLSTVTSPVHSGSYACKLVSTGGSYFDVIATDAFTNTQPGQTFTGSAYVRSNSLTGGSVFAAMQEWNGSTMVKTTYGSAVTLTTGWQKVSNTTTISSGVTKVVFYVVEDPGYASQVFFVDDMYFSSGSSGSNPTNVPTIASTIAPNPTCAPPPTCYRNGALICLMPYGGWCGFTPTSAPTNFPTAIPTARPTDIPVPTDTPAPGSTVLAFSLSLHGIGTGGDSANPSSLGNQNPLHDSRDVTVDVYDVQNQLVVSQQGSMQYNSNSGKFDGSVNLGTNFSTGLYTVKVKTDQYLRTLFPGIQSISSGQTTTLPLVTLVTGDLNNDNAINIVDYNILIGCYSDLLPATDCNATNNVLADITDDGHVNQFDYNLFLRELTNIGGQ